LVKVLLVISVPFESVVLLTPLIPTAHDPPSMVFPEMMVLSAEVLTELMTMKLMFVCEETP